MRLRQRHQAGSVQQRLRGGKMVWLGLYWDVEGKRKITPPLEARTRSQALSRMAEFMIPINQERSARFKDANMDLAAYCEHTYIPFGERKWKASTAGTTTQRIRQHIVNGSLGSVAVSKLDRESMQSFLDGMKHCSASLVNHLRFDLQAILRLAVADGLLPRNQAEALYTPRTCTLPSKPVMTIEQVRQALGVLELRERLFCRFAIFAGMRPGEIIALRWADIDGSTATVDDRIYKGVSAEPKNRKTRVPSLAPSVLRDLALWRQFAIGDYVFSSENGRTAIKYENLWQREIKPLFKKLGLEWADFRCMRRTNSTLMKVAGADVKVSADQRGHNVGVSINEYTESTAAQKLAAVNLLDQLILIQ